MEKENEKGEEEKVEEKDEEKKINDNNKENEADYGVEKIEKEKEADEVMALEKRKDGDKNGKENNKPVTLPSQSSLPSLLPLIGNKKHKQKKEKTATPVSVQLPVPTARRIMFLTAVDATLREKGKEEGSADGAVLPSIGRQGLITADFYVGYMEGMIETKRLKEEEKEREIEMKGVEREERKSKRRGKNRKREKSGERKRNKRKEKKGDEKDKNKEKRKRDKNKKQRTTRKGRSEADD
jgi:hypothetical protein